MYAFGDGFDLYAAVGDYAAYWDTMGIATSMILGSPGRFAGTRCLRNSGGSQTLLTKNGANDSIHHLNFAYSNTDNQNTTPTATAIGFTLFDGGTAQCTVNFREDGVLELRSGVIGGTVLASWIGAYFGQSVWHTYEIEIVVHNTAGSITVRRNGNPSNDFTATGLNTRAGTTNNYANRMSIVTGTISGTSGCYIDDILWRSDPSSVPWIGDVRCYTRMPSADASVQFSKAPFNAGNANFTYVDEAQQDSYSSYVYNSTTGQNDLYSLAASATPAGTVTAVTTRGLLMKGDAPGAIGAQMQLKSGATTVQSPAFMLGTNFLYQYRTDLVDPNTSVAWTAANVDAAQIGPIVTDNLDISFLAPPLDPRITLTRASVGTYFDVNGILLTAPTGAPRFDFDPISHAARGLLIEEARTNLYVQSGDLSQASSNVAPNDCIKTANQAIAPDSTNSAALCVPGTGVGNHGVYRSFAGTFSVSHVYSVFLKAAGYNTVQVALSNTGFPANCNANFNLSTGTVISTGAGASASGIISVGNGWYRCWVAATALASGTMVALFSPYSGTLAFAGDGVSGVYAWGAQAEVGAFPTSYIPTAGAGVARSADVASMSFSGSWYNQSTGTFQTEYIPQQAAGSGTQEGIIRWDDGTANNYAVMFLSNANQTFATAVAATVQQINNNTGAPTYNAVSKSAIAYGGGLNWRAQTNGGALSTGGGSTVFTATRVLLGLAGSGGATWQLNGCMRRVRYWNRALSNAELLAVTT